MVFSVLRSLCFDGLSGHVSVIATGRQGISAGFKTCALNFSSKPVSHRIKVKDRDLHYVTVGSGPKVLVCIPGTLGFAQGDYIFQLKGLNHKKLTIIGWDPLGQGLSRPPDRDFSGNYFQRDAEYLSEMMEKLGHKKYSALGWSQGGVTGVHLAALFPENIEKLVVFGTFACIDDKVMNNKQLEFIDNWSEEMKGPFIKFYGEQYVRDQWDAWKASLARFVKEQGGDMGHRNLLKNVKCPTLIIHGDSDPIVPPSHAEYLHKNIAGSRLHMWPKGKHNLQLRYPEEFNYLVEQFVVDN